MREHYEGGKSRQARISCQTCHLELPLAAKLLLRDSALRIPRKVDYLPAYCSVRPRCSDCPVQCTAPWCSEGSSTIRFHVEGLRLHSQTSEVPAAVFEALRKTNILLSGERTSCILSSLGGVAGSVYRRTAALCFGTWVVCRGASAGSPLPSSAHV
jgi:hypothetical protein